MKAEELEWSGTNIHGQNETRDLPSRVEAVEIYFQCTEHRIILPSYSRVSLDFSDNRLDSLAQRLTFTYVPASNHII